MSIEEFVVSFLLAAARNARESYMADTESAIAFVIFGCVARRHLGLDPKSVVLS